MLQLTTIFLFLFGLFAAVGGIIGFVKAKSRASLIAGVISGLLLDVAGVLLVMGQTRAGLLTGLIVSLLLAFRFVPQFLNKRTFMPAGAMALFSLVGAMLTGWSLYAY